MEVRMVVACLGLLAPAAAPPFSQPANYSGDAESLVKELAPDLLKGCGVEKLTEAERGNLYQAICRFADDVAWVWGYHALPASAKRTSTGLEGVKRLSVTAVCEKGVEDLINESTLKSLVELQIRKAGIGLEVVEPSHQDDGCLWLGFSGLKHEYARGGETGQCTFHAHIDFCRTAYVFAPAGATPAIYCKALAETWTGLGSIWDTENSEVAQRAKAWAMEQVAVFLNEWMKANPKRPSSPSGVEESAVLSDIGQPEAEESPSPRTDGGLVTRGVAYPGVGGGHWVQKVIDRGDYVKLEDGSLWEISTLDRINTCIWLPIDDITVVDNDSVLYPYKLVNTDQSETAEARCLSR